MRSPPAPCISRPAAVRRPRLRLSPARAPHACLSAHWCPCSLPRTLWQAPAAHSFPSRTHLLCLTDVTLIGVPAPRPWRPRRPPCCAVPCTLLYQRGAAAALPQAPSHPRPPIAAARPRRPRPPLPPALTSPEHGAAATETHPVRPDALSAAHPTPTPQPPPRACPVCVPLARARRIARPQRSPHVACGRRPAPADVRHLREHAAGMLPSPLTGQLAHTC